MAIQVKKPNALLAAVNRAVPKEEAGITQFVGVEPRGSTPLESSTKVRRSSSHRPSRVGTKLIAGHFDPKVARQLRIIAAEEDTTVQALLEEALDLLFVKKGRAHIKEIGDS